MNRYFCDIWDEFLALGWSKRENRKNNIKDLEISPKVFLREMNGEWKLYYLPIATILVFPAPWPSMWSEFNVWVGELIYYVTGVKEIVTGINQFGKLMTLWTSHINSSLCSSSKDEVFEQILPSLIDCGTSDFRKWMEDEYKIELKPWSLITPQDTRKI